MSKVTAKMVATALAKADKLVGQSCGTDKQQSVKQRAANLLTPKGAYGPYVRDGDPHGWGGGRALVTIYLEPKGTDDDCIIEPLDYYGTGFAVLAKADEFLPGDALTEYVNAAVACVYE